MTFSRPHGEGSQHNHHDLKLWCNPFQAALLFECHVTKQPLCVPVLLTVGDVKTQDLFVCEPIQYNSYLNPSYCFNHYHHHHHHHCPFPHLPATSQTCGVAFLQIIYKAYRLNPNFLVLGTLWETFNRHMVKTH